MRYKDVLDFLEKGAIFSLSKDELIIGFGDVKESKTYQKDSFFVSDFFLKDFKFISFENTKLIKTKDLKNLLNEENPDCLEWRAFSKESFYKSFSCIKDEIKKGHFEKMVPFEKETAREKMTKQRLSFLLQKIFNKQSAGFIYGFWDQKKGFLGLSPEILFEKQDSYLKTFALAGTSLKEQSLMNDSKEIKEHNFVVSFLMEKLKKLGDVHCEKMKTVHFKPLYHLKTELKVELKKSFEFLSMIHYFHPTPALGTFPGEKWKFLEELDHFERGFFGAPFGFSGCIDKAVVSIRGVFWDEKEISIKAGCGIVEESVFENEYQEIQNKIKSVKEFFEL